jgi:hypothetical protein
MEQQVVAIVLHGYHVQLLGAEKPRIRITLGRQPPILDDAVRESGDGAPKVLLHFSTDVMQEGPKRGAGGIAVAIEGKQTPSTLKLAKKVPDSRLATCLTACSILSFHEASTVKCFAEASQTWVRQGNTIPISFFTERGKFLCTIEASEVGEFSLEGLFLAAKLGMQGQRPN